MPNNWKTNKLGELADIKGGKRLPKGDVLVTSKTQHPYIRVTDMGTRIIPIEKLQYVPNDVFPKISRYIVNTNDLILSIVGTVGSISIIDDKLDNASLTENCVKITNMKNIDSEYLYYYLTSDIGQFEISKGIVGSTQPKLPIYNINSIEISLPENLQEQKSIAQILSTIDDKIENNLAINKTLEEMAMALYKHWFVDSAIDDWEKYYLKDLIEIKGGFSYKGEFIGKGESLLLGMGCVSFSERFVSSGARLYSGECNANHYVKPGEIVLATRQQSDNFPILGQPAIIPKYLSENKIIVGTNLYRVKNNSDLSNSLLFQILKSKEYMEHVLANASGTTVKMITKDVIELYELALPPKHLILNYNEKISAISDKIEQNTIENQTLTQLRDTLLPKLISGEVRLKAFRE